MKIIDFEKKGNVVRFYLGVDDDFKGDDWNDTPYDCNAGRVYDEYICGHQDLLIPFNYAVLEPKDPEWERHNWCKDDMKMKKIPCIVIKRLAEDDWREEERSEYFSKIVGDAEAVKIYLGNEMADIKQKLHEEFGEEIMWSIVCYTKF